MTKTVISGGTGFVGRFIVEALLAEGHDVITLGRNPFPPGYFSQPVRFVQVGLGDNFDFQRVFYGAQNFIHAALDHVPGHYHRGEGRDKKGFALKNLAGSAALFKQAKKAGVNRAVFLSDMAVYGQPLDGSHFYETDETLPDGLYAKVKREMEKILETMTTSEFAPVTLRLSSVYGPAGPGRSQKWDGMFKGYLAGMPIEPKATCEIHGEDVGRAITEILDADHVRVAGGIFNAMDLVVDRADILAPLQNATGCQHPLPERFDGEVSTMNCDKLKRMNWRTGGIVKMGMTLERMITPYVKAA